MIYHFLFFFLVIFYIVKENKMIKKIDYSSHADRSDNERDKELYEGDEVIVKKPCAIEAINGYSGAYGIKEN